MRGFRRRFGLELALRRREEQARSEDDHAKAVEDLTQATAVIKAPPEAFRSLGLAYKARSDAKAAVPAFEKYLALSPAAPDAALIKGYLSELKP